MKKDDEIYKSFCEDTHYFFGLDMNKNRKMIESTLCYHHFKMNYLMKNLIKEIKKELKGVFSWLKK